MAYNKIDRKAYKYYCFNPMTRKIRSGWEYREDAIDYKKETGQKGLKVYTRTFLINQGIDPNKNDNWGSEGIHGVKYKPKQEVVLYGDFRKEVQIPEIKVRYNKGKTFQKISDSKEVYQFLKRVYGRQIGIQEHFVLLLTDNNLNIIGYYKHTVGTPVSTLADIPMLMGIVLKSMARSFIISHNHPSGNTRPSEADQRLTKQIKNAAGELSLTMLDHIIVTAKNGYYSFADNGGLGSVPAKQNKKISLEKRLREEILTQLRLVNERPKLTPEVHKLIQTEKGYAWMENRIIRMMVTDGITASATIPQIESELS